MCITLNTGSYFVIPSTFDRGKTGIFYLSIYCSDENCNVIDGDIIAEEEEVSNATSMIGSINATPRRLSSNTSNNIINKNLSVSITTQLINAKLSTRSVGETEVSIFNPNKLIDDDYTSATYIASRYEKAREDVMNLCDRRGINPEKVLQDYSNYSQNELDENISLKVFKSALINIGFQLCDLPDDTVKILGGKNNRFNLQDIVDLFQFEKQRREVETMKQKYSKEIDDLEFAQLEGDGIINVNVIEARDLVLTENVIRDDTEDFISWIYQPSCEENYLKKVPKFFNNLPFMKSGLQKLRLAATKFIEKEQKGALKELKLINNLQLPEYQPYIWYPASFEKMRELKQAKGNENDDNIYKDYREKSMKYSQLIPQLQYEFASLGVYMTGLNISCIINYLPKDYSHLKKPDGTPMKKAYNTFIEYFRDVYIIIIILHLFIIYRLEVKIILKYYLLNQPMR